MRPAAGSGRLEEISPVLPTTGLFPPIPEEFRKCAAPAQNKIYVGRLPEAMTARELRRVAEEFGPVKSASIAKDGRTGGSRGYGFVEFLHADSVHMAVGQEEIEVELESREAPGGKHRLKVGVLPAQKQLLEDQGRKSSTALYVSNVAQEIEEEDIERIFGCLGMVKRCVLLPGQGGRHMGCGYVEYHSARSAEHALRGLDRLSLAGRNVRVSRAVGEAPEGARRRADSERKKASDLRRSRWIMLGGMISADDLTMEFEREVRCEMQRFGDVEEMRIAEGEGVEIYVKYSSEEESNAARDAMDRRWFGGRRIKAAKADENTVPR